MFFFHFLRYDHKLRSVRLGVFLYDSCNTHLMFPEHLRDLRQNTRAVFNLHPKEEFIFHISEIFYGKLLITCTAYPSAASVFNISRLVDHIPYNRACRRHLSCASSVEHRIVHCISVNKYSVKRISYRCQRMISRDHDRVNSDLDSFRRISRHTKQLDHAVKLFGIGDICRRNFCNSFRIHIRKHDS